MARIKTKFTQISIAAAPISGTWVYFATRILTALDGDKSAQRVSNVNLYITRLENFNLW